MAKILKTAVDWSSLYETIKEPARLFIMALIGWGISQLAKTDQTLTVAIVTVVLKSLDKTIHDFGKDNDRENLSKGITGWIGV